MAQNLDDDRPLYEPVVERAVAAERERVRRRLEELLADYKREHVEEEAAGEHAAADQTWGCVMGVQAALAAIDPDQPL